MANRILVLILLFMMGTHAGCSHTPGDAALRGGHEEAAADLYVKGAEQGDPEAALKLGLLLNNGSVSTEAYGQASRWFQKACELGSLPGCHNLGIAYEYGNDGVVKDLNKAYECYLKAAERGYMQSQYNLSSLYSNGYIEPQDNVEGLKWMLLSQKAARACKLQICEWILKDPPGHKEKLKERMTPSEIKKAENLAETWIERKGS
jgi:TPR repeat protein